MMETYLRCTRNEDNLYASHCGKHLNMHIQTSQKFCEISTIIISILHPGKHRASGSEGKEWLGSKIRHNIWP